MTLALPGYRVGEQFAAGRRGPVHRGVRLADSLGVVIHLLHQPLDERQRQRFVAEAAELRRLPAHPAIVPLLDAGIAADGHPYLIIPAGEGTLVDRLAAEGPLPVDDVLEAGVSAAAGLAALHGAGLLHGNLTPGNLLLLANGVVALTGFAPSVLAELDAAALSPWRPPEVLQGGEWSVAGDLYALAATLFALLSGDPPHGRADTGLLLRALSQPVPRVDRADLPEAVDAVLRRALDPNPAARFESATALATALRGGASLSGSTAHRDTLAPGMPPPPRTGRPLGRGYLLHDLIGRGASGEVWRGVRSTDNQPIAVKLLRPELAEQPEMVARFVRERTTLLRLDHPNLVRVRDLVVEGTTLALVMDLIDGTDLRRTMRRAPLTQADAYAVLGQVARALDAIHAAGVVHRDLKPENVLVARCDGAVKAWLTDFGIARGATDATLTRASQLVGTPAYVAPEVATGQRATPAADVYAFGVMGYELLAGVRPFDADHPMALLHAHVTEEPARPDGVPEAAWQALRACLAKDPAGRPSAAWLADSFAALAAHLASGVSPGPLPALPDTSDPGHSREPLLTAAPERPLPRAPTEPPPKRRGRLRLLTVAALVVALAGGVFGVLVARRAPQTVFVDVPVTAISPRPGQVTLRFSGGPDLDGFQFYTVFRDATLLDRNVPGTATRYPIPELDQGTRFCFRVRAVVLTHSPPPKKTRVRNPACLTADGHSTSP
jgi:serine/threonine protein kinase